MDFVEAASKDPALRKKWLDGFKENLAAEELIKHFYSLGYEGVSLDDCDTILSTISDPKKLATVWDQKY